MATGKNETAVIPMAIPTPALQLARRCFLEWLEVQAHLTSLQHQSHALMSRVVLGGPGVNVNGLLLNMPPLTAELKEWQEEEQVRRRRFHDAIKPLLHVNPEAWYLLEEGAPPVPNRPIHPDLIAYTLQVISGFDSKLSG